MYKEVNLTQKFVDFITGFDITVETIKDIFPSVSYRLDDLFYDTKSFAEAYLSEWCTYTVHYYMYVALPGSSMIFSMFDNIREPVTSLVCMPVQLHNKQ